MATTTTTSSTTSTSSSTTTTSTTTTVAPYEEINDTLLANMALAGLGANRISDIEDDTSTQIETIQCRLHFEQTRDALLRSHRWRFAKARATLAEVSTTPEFEWERQYHLPQDFLFMRAIYMDNATPNKTTLDTYSLEGKLLLTNATSVEIRYTKQVRDPYQFDPLFIELFIIDLKLKLVMPLTQSVKLKDQIMSERKELMPTVRALDREEGDTLRRNEMPTWAGARHGSIGGRTPGRMGS